MPAEGLPLCMRCFKRTKAKERADKSTPARAKKELGKIMDMLED